MGEGCPTQKGCQRSSLMSYLLLLLPIVQEPLAGRPAISPQSPCIWGVCARVHVFVSYAGNAEEPPTHSLMEDRTWSRTWPPGQGQVAHSSVVLSLYSFQSAFYLSSVLDLYTYTLRQARQESLPPFPRPGDWSVSILKARDCLGCLFLELGLDPGWRCWKNLPLCLQPWDEECPCFPPWGKGL